MSYNESPWEKLMRRDRARAKAKATLVEKQHKETDVLLTHTAQVPESRRMPHKLPGARAWFHRMFTRACTTPVHKGLMMLMTREVHITEGVMSRWLVIPDILDEDLETDYKAIVRKYSGSMVDYSEPMTGEGDDKH